MKTLLKHAKKGGWVYKAANLYAKLGTSDTLRARTKRWLESI
jgi:hypothetical protein